MDETRCNRLARLLAWPTGRRALPATIGLVTAGLAMARGGAARPRRRCIHDGRRCGKRSGNRGG